MEGCGVIAMQEVPVPQHIITFCYIERIEENERNCCEMDVSGTFEKVDVL